MQFVVWGGTAGINSGVIVHIVFGGAVFRMWGDAAWRVSFLIGKHVGRLVGTGMVLCGLSLHLLRGHGVCLIVIVRRHLEPNGVQLTRDGRVPPSKRSQSKPHAAL